MSKSKKLKRHYHDIAKPLSLGPPYSRMDMLADEAIDELAKAEAQIKELTDNCIRHGETIHQQELQIKELTEQRTERMDDCERLNVGLQDRARELTEALRIYADKRNWTRSAFGHLNGFTYDTNGPFIALEALAKVKS